MNRTTSALRHTLPIGGHARREFIRLFGGAGMLMLLPRAASAAEPQRSRLAERLLFLVELKGGNDGLNTLIPYADPAYLALRPRIGIRRDVVLPLDERRGLHPALEPMMPLWQARELAIIRNVLAPRGQLHLTFEPPTVGQVERMAKETVARLEAGGFSGVVVRKGTGTTARLIHVSAV